MDALVGCTVTALLALSAAGAGLALLRILRLQELLPALELWPTAFTVGAGVLGWLVFFPGIAGFLEKPTLAAVLLIGVAGWIPVLRGGGPARPRSQTTAQENRRILAILLVILAASLTFDVLAALAPPADADSLAYHFALPKRFLAAGRVEFVPRAVDGAPPLLLHMTYTLALGLGGEKALTLWTTVLGWIPAWLLYAIGRRFLSPAWALTLAILFLDTPAVVYGANAGQMEVKLAAFALVAAFAAADSVRSDKAGFAVLAGVAAGSFLAAKYNGVIFAAAAGLALLTQRAWLRSGLAYGLAVIATAWQWYVWNYVNSGDPLFPLLYDWLGAKDGLWSPQMAAYFGHGNFSSEAPAPVNLLWAAAYPFVATFRGLPQWESARTGLGPFALLALPFAACGVWQNRHRIASHSLMIPLAIAAIFYVAWYLSGTSQRVRHLLPIYPVILICVGVAGARFAEASRLAAMPFAASAALTILVQFGGHGVFALNYLRYWLTGESRETFLERNVARYAPVPWINAHLKPTDRLLVTERQLVYDIDIPVYSAQPLYQYLVDLIPGDSNARRFAGELKRLGITHILLMPSLADVRRGVRHIWTDELATYTRTLADAGCARVLQTFAARATESRTLPALAGNVVSADVIEVRPAQCRL